MKTEKELSSVKERLLHFIKTLNLTISDFEKKCGLANGYVNNIRKSIKHETFEQKISPNFPQLRRSWLFFNDGEMLDDSIIPDLDAPAKPSIISTNQHQIPMYNFPTAAGEVEVYDDPNDSQIIGYLSIPGAHKDTFALPVRGHSMHPTLSNGDWGLLRPIENKTAIVWGEVYYIEWEDYRMFKRLLVAEKADEVTLWSDNQDEEIAGRPKYAPIIIKKDDIRELCLLTDILKKPNH